MIPDKYSTVELPSVSDFRDRGSRFLGFVYPVSDKEDFKRFREQLKKEHPKASHVCFAYRLGPEGSEFRVSDDGEPSGTAGRPILGQIDSRNLTETVVFVVRYFGGTLLGVPGLIHAYKTAAAAALDASRIIQKPVLVTYNLEFDYTILNEVLRIVKQTESIVRKQELQLFCSVSLGIPKSHLNGALEKFNKLKGLAIHPR